MLDLLKNLSLRDLSLIIDENLMELTSPPGFPTIDG
jgi:hypothetical protein